MNKLAIVTVNFNGTADTVELAIDLKKVSVSNFEIKIIVVDNGSKPGLLSALKKAKLEVDFVQTGENKGFAGGYNMGIKYALEWGADYVWIINNDTLIPDKKVAEKLIKVLQDKPNVGAVSPKIWFAPGYEFFKDKYTKKDEGRVIWYAGGSMDWNNVRVVHQGIDEVDSGQYDEVSQTEFISGCSVMTTREAWQKVGFFDESLFAYFEDVDWILRMAGMGMERMYAGNTGIFHKVSRTAGIGSPMTDYLLTRNRLTVAMRLPQIKLRTKLALVREAVRWLALGRPAQRRGIWDYLNGEVGAGPFVQKTGEVEYDIDVSVVTINYKTPDLTEGLVKSILKKGSGWEKIKGELIVLDNASDDDMGQRMKRYPAVKFIQNKINNGFSGGNNQMIRFARGKYLLMLNSDMEIKPGALNELLVQAQKQTAVMTAKLYFPDGTIQDSCFKLPTVWGAIKEYFLGIAGSYFMFYPKGENVVPVEGTVMASFMIPREVLNQVGYLSEETFMYFEDIEYCRRLKTVGTPVLYCPKAEIIHYHGMSSKKIGLSKSVELLKKGSLYYHGPLNYALLYITLWLGQRIGRTSTPKSRWSS